MGMTKLSKLYEKNIMLKKIELMKERRVQWKKNYLGL